MSKHDEQAVSAEPGRIGIAVLYSADRRSLDATLASIARSRIAPARLLVVAQPVLNRKLDAAGLPAEAQLLQVAAWLPARLIALESLADCDLVVLLREGVVLSPSAISIERARFETDPGLVACLTMSRLHLDVEEASQTDASRDLYAAVAGTKDRRFASRYFSACMLAIAPKRGEGGSFERFATRSDWAAGRFYLDSLPSGSKTIEIESDAIGFVGSRPDRRESWRQGFEAIEELHRFRASFPRYGALVAADIRRLFIEQLFGIASLRPAAPRLRFLLGAIAALHASRQLKARLRRDIASLS